MGDHEMKDGNVIQQKTYAFAIRIVKMYRHIVETKKEYVLSKQVLKCGTSIGANVEEAIGGQSTADFVAKLGIAYKEARETSYWLRLLKDTDYLKRAEFESLHADVAEILRILTRIQTTTKKRIQKQ